MPTPIDFKESNVTLTGSPDRSVADLHVLRTENAAYSCWELSPEEIKQIAQTGRLWVGVLGGYLPPLFVTVDKPPEVVMEGHRQQLSPNDRLRLETPN